MKFPSGLEEKERKKEKEKKTKMLPENSSDFMHEVNCVGAK